MRSVLEQASVPLSFILFFFFFYLRRLLRGGNHPTTSLDEEIWSEDPRTWNANTPLRSSPGNHTMTSNSPLGPNDHVAGNVPRTDSAVRIDPNTSPRSATNILTLPSSIFPIPRINHIHTEWEGGEGGGTYNPLPLKLIRQQPLHRLPRKQPP